MAGVHVVMHVTQGVAQAPEALKKFAAQVLPSWNILYKPLKDPLQIRCGSRGHQNCELMSSGENLLYPDDVRDMVFVADLSQVNDLIFHVTFSADGLLIWVFDGVALVCVDIPHSLYGAEATRFEDLINFERDRFALIQINAIATRPIPGSHAKLLIVKALCVRRIIEYISFQDVELERKE